jgi:hypothetical protein
MAKKPTAEDRQIAIDEIAIDGMLAMMEEIATVAKNLHTAFAPDAGVADTIETRRLQMSGALVAVALFVERVLDRQLAAVLERIERIEEEIKENGAMGRAIHDQLAVRDQWIAAKADIVDGRRAGPGRHFNELSLALVDLNAGAKPSLLAPPKGRKTPDPSRRWGSRARVALLVRDLMMSGMTEKNAATKIAKDYPDLVKIAGAKANRPEANLVDTILNWHKRFLAKRVKNAHAALLFELELDALKKFHMK